MKSNSKFIKKGTEKENGATYKVDLIAYEPLSVNDGITAEFVKVSNLKNKLQEKVAKYNILLEIRDEVATCAPEYLRNSMVGRVYNDEYQRTLILKGCNVEMEELKRDIDRMESEWGNGRY